KKQTRDRRITIGRYGSPRAVEGARAKALSLAAVASTGGDPAMAASTPKGGWTVAPGAGLYLGDSDKSGRGGRPNKKASTWKIDEQQIRQHIVPVLGNKLVEDVTSDDVEALQARVAKVRPCDTRPQRTGGGVGAAVRTVAVLSTLLSFAIKRKLFTG